MVGAASFVLFEYVFLACIDCSQVLFVLLGTLRATFFTYSRHCSDRRSSFCRVPSRSECVCSIWSSLLAHCLVYQLWDGFQFPFCTRHCTFRSFVALFLRCSHCIYSDVQSLIFSGRPGSVPSCRDGQLTNCGIRLQVSKGECTREREQGNVYFWIEKVESLQTGGCSCSPAAPAAGGIRVAGVSSG